MKIELIFKEDDRFVQTDTENSCQLKFPVIGVWTCVAYDFRDPKNIKGMCISLFSGPGVEKANHVQSN